MSIDFNNEEQLEIDAYLNNTMSNEECIVFEKKIQNDPILKKEIELYISLKESFNDQDWNSLDRTNNNIQSIKNSFRSKEYQNLSKKIKAVENSYSNNNKKNNFNFYKISMAIAVVLILIIGVPLFFNSNSLSNHYDDYQNWEDIPLLTEKGTQNKSQEIENLYVSNNFNDLIKLYETNNKKLYHDYSLIKIGHTYIKLEKSKQALEVFDKLIASDKLTSSRGYWYKLLIYLKLEDKDNSISQLNLILENPSNYNYDEAKEILKKIQ